MGDLAGACWAARDCRPGNRVKAVPAAEPRGARRPQARPFADIEFERPARPLNRLRASRRRSRYRCSASSGQSALSASSSYRGRRDGLERDPERPAGRSSRRSAARRLRSCRRLPTNRSERPRSAADCRRCTTATTSRASKKASRHSNPLISPTPSHTPARTNTTAAIRYRCTNELKDPTALPPHAMPGQEDQVRGRITSSLTTRPLGSGDW